MNPEDTIIIRCPKCKWTNEAEKGDKLYPHYSTKKPRESEVHEDIITKVVDCRNSKCLEPFDVYYFRAKDIFKVIYTQFSDSYF